MRGKGAAFRLERMDAPVNVLEPLLLLCLRNFRAAAGINLSVEFLFKNLREGFQMG